jgi:Domain of unknown function (DUF4389)
VTDQPIFEAEYVEQRSRVSTFFRYLLAIPHYFVLFFYGFGAFFAIVVAWFALVFTGNFPPGIYRFLEGYLKYTTAVYAYLALLTDEYPPFGPDADNYPARIVVPPPKAQYSRMKALFRIILVIPVAIILYAMQLVWNIGAFLAWFVIVVTGKQPKGLQDMIVLGLSYQLRANAYLWLLTEDWPPFIDEQGGSLASGPGGTGLPPAPPTSAPPAAPEAPGARGGISGGDPLAGNPKPFED